MSSIVAIEGPSDSGKSTLAAGLARHFADRHPLVFPCYVDQVEGEEPPEFTTDVERQLRAVDFYLELEAQRHRELAASGAELTILDRSAYTLLAHSYAIQKLHGTQVFERCLEKVTTGPEVIIPAIVLYLDAGAGERSRRADPEDDGKWFTDNRFNDEIRTFFLTHFPECGAAAELRVLDASRGEAAVLADAIATISSNSR